MFEKFLPSKARVAGKKIAVQSVVRTNVARRIVEKVVEFDDKIQEFTTQTWEITPDNLVSKGLRKLFGINLPVEVPKAIQDKTAKSKWHEILKRASSASEAESSKSRLKSALEMDQKGVKVPVEHYDVLQDLAVLHPEDRELIEEFQKDYPMAHINLGKK